MLCPEEKEEKRRSETGGVRFRGNEPNQSIPLGSFPCVSRISHREGAELAHREAQKVTFGYFVMAMIRKALRQLNELSRRYLQRFRG